MRVGVIGSGSIGPDLAYGFLSSLAAGEGGAVFLLDINREALDAGVRRIEGYVSKALGRGKMSPGAAKAIRAMLTPTMEIGDLATCDYVLEAATENLETKKAILANLEKIVGPDCLIGFATSGIPRAWIAAGALRPERCFVNHPFFPAWRTTPIEVVPSGDAALSERMVSVLKSLGKVPILTADVEAFAADDIFCNYISEAVRIVEDTVPREALAAALGESPVELSGTFDEPRPVVAALALDARDEHEAGEYLAGLAAVSSSLVLIEATGTDALGPRAGDQALVRVGVNGAGPRTRDDLESLAVRSGWQLTDATPLGWGVEALTLEAAPAR